MSRRFEYHKKCGGVLHAYDRTKVCGLCGAKWFADVLCRRADELKKEDRA